MQRTKRRIPPIYGFIFYVLLRNYKTITLQTNETNHVQPAVENHLGQTESSPQLTLGRESEYGRNLGGQRTMIQYMT